MNTKKSIPGVEWNKIIKFLKKENLWEHVSPKEIDFFKKQESPWKDNIQAFWRSEAAWILLWALRHINDLAMPVEQCSVKTIVDSVPSPRDSTTDFIENAKLRSISDILDVSDLMYRAHWATRDSGINDDTECANLDEDIAMEWHYAINWPTCYNDADWDDVTTDT